MKKYFYIIFLFTSITLFAQYAKRDLYIIYEYNDYGGYKQDLTLKVQNQLAQFIYHKNKTSLKNEEGMEFFHFYEHYENFIDLSDKKITEKRVLKNKTILLADWNLDINWEITNETKEINGYKVTKAIAKPYIKDLGDFEYGNAIAWFTTEIPVSVGPVRYYGLPGLIVLLEFEEIKSRYFILKEIKYDVDLNLITLPTEGIKVSKEEIIEPYIINKKWLKKQKKAYRKKQKHQ